MLSCRLPRARGSARGVRVFELDTGNTAWMLAASAPGAVHDAGAGVLLRRAHTKQERRGHDHALVHHDRGGGRALGGGRLLARIRARPGSWADRQPRPLWAARRWRRVRRERRARPPLHGLPDDVRHHHARRSSRAPSPSAPGSDPSSSSSPSGRSSSTPRSPTGCSA